MSSDWLNLLGSGFVTLLISLSLGDRKGTEGFLIILILGVGDFFLGSKFDSLEQLVYFKLWSVKFSLILFVS